MTLDEMLPKPGILPELVEAYDYLAKTLPKAFNKPIIDADANRAYLESGLPTYFVISLLSTGHTVQEICDFSAGKELNGVLFGIRNTMGDSKDENMYRYMCLAKAVPDIEERSTQLINMWGTHREEMMQEALQAEIDDPIAYAASLTDTEIQDYGCAFTEYRVLKIMKRVPPEHFKTIQPLFKIMDFNRREDFFQNKVKETLDAYCALSPEKREMFNPSEPVRYGVLLRTLGDFSSDNYKTFQDDWCARFQLGFYVKPKMEDSLEEFFEMYLEADDDYKNSILDHLHDLDEDNRAFTMDLMLDCEIDSNRFRDGYTMAESGLSGGTLFEILEHNGLAKQFIDIPRHNKSAWFDLFNHSLSPSDMAAIPLGNIKRTIQAYNMALSRKQKFEFINGYRQVAPANLGKWADAIIGHYHKGTTGGDSYRRMNDSGVIAA
jgi:hypothetical protein